MSKVNFEVKDGSFNLEVDPNEDGEKVLGVKLHLTEAIQEAIARGTPVEGAKIVDFKFNLSKLILTLDTDKDGEKLLELEIDLAEGFDEIQDAISKKDESPAS